MSHNKLTHMEIQSTGTQNTANKIWLRNQLFLRGKRSTSDRHKVTGLQVDFPGSGPGMNHCMEIMETDG